MTCRPGLASRPRLSGRAILAVTPGGAVQAVLAIAPVAPVAAIAAAQRRTLRLRRLLERFVG